jgi:hypothetical protein
VECERRGRTCRQQARNVGKFKRAIGRVIQIHPISILAPLVVGVVAQAGTIIIYLVPVRATVNLILREKGLGHVGMPWTDLGIFARTVFYASLAHLVEIALWAALFHNLRRIYRLRNRLLPLRGQLHVLGLR